MLRCLNRGKGNTKEIDAEVEGRVDAVNERKDAKKGCRKGSECNLSCLNGLHLKDGQIQVIKTAMWCADI